MTYFEHLWKNWKVAFHALTDFFAHFIHGIFPFIKIRHHQPIPKGHGRLIDADEIQFENAEFDTYGDYCRAFDAIDQADTIIEADNEHIQ